MDLNEADNKIGSKGCLNLAQAEWPQLSDLHLSK